MIHWGNLGIWCEVRLQIYFLHVNVQFSLAPLLGEGKRSFSDWIEWFWHPCHKCLGLFQDFLFYIIELYIHAYINTTHILLIMTALCMLWNWEMGVHQLCFFFKIVLATTKVLVTQLCPILCDPLDYNLPGLPVHGILQARILEWVAIPFSRVSSNPGIELRSPALQADSATMNSSNLQMNLKNKLWTSAKKAPGIWVGSTLNSKINLGSIVLFNNTVSWSMSMRLLSIYFSSAQSLSHVRLSATP